MKERCYNPNFFNFAKWGGRGITVCDEWRNSFEAFYAHVGERPPGKSIDRINNDLGYEPGNVRWATASEQAQNKSNTGRFTFNGETKTITQWASKWQVSRGALAARLKRGVPFDQVAARMPSTAAALKIKRPQTGYQHLRVPALCWILAVVDGAQFV